jgi:hypothetical protein
MLRGVRLFCQARRACGAVDPRRGPCPRFADAASAASYTLLLPLVRCGAMPNQTTIMAMHRSTARTRGRQ